MKIAVIGLWHQGVVGAACLADLGYDVLAADTDRERVDRLTEGKAPLYEPGLDELIRKGLDSRRLQFTTDLSAAVRGRPNILLMFDTPVDDNDDSDLGEIRAAVSAIAPHLEPDAVILVTAQVPVGTCDEIHQMTRHAVAYIPENLQLGQAIERFRTPPLPVVGADDNATLDRIEALLAPLPVHWERVTLRTAEMTKHALNSFLAVSICFANELGNLCDEVGADGRRLAEVLRLEPRIGAKARLSPGLGFAGGTLARDMQTLRKLGDRNSIETPLLDGAWVSNQRQNRTVIHKLKQSLGENLRGRRIAILGLTYKPETSTLRRSAALEIAGELIREGAEVWASDPRASRDELRAYPALHFVENPYDAIRQGDALVLMTPWKQYRELDFEAIRSGMTTPLLIDTANLWNADHLTSLGFLYIDIGSGRTRRRK
jgi:UDPglucose 6-dehydrogenase